jgi:hypothetical protein
LLASGHDWQTSITLALRHTTRPLYREREREREREKQTQTQPDSQTHTDTHTHTHEIIRHLHSDNTHVLGQRLTLR